VEQALNDQQVESLEKNDWAEAARIAAGCETFSPDDEDEQVADEPRSCHNCRYRRWTAASFSCCKENTIAIRAK
jgi:hypothetical protein